ncbi:MAG: HD domain-containing protein [Patescibacteria group bacterium]|jgi:putative nucleotidyltransferase with HDIG domain
MTYRIKLPPEVQQVLQTLQANHYAGYVVGGCLRDLILGNEPKDWDVTTNALPKQIQAVFPKTLYLNDFGTVTVRSGALDIEVTTFRSDGQYSDFRHPDKVQFGVSLKEDLARRDFTINALAFDGNKIYDEFDGEQDIKSGLLRAVGNADERFNEDALRMLRAIRFSSQLRFKIEKHTWQAIIKNNQLIKHVSAERIRDELIKMISAEDSLKAFWLLHESGLLKIIIPELEAGFGVTQNLHHIYTVFAHNLLSMQFCPSDDWRLRLAALLHDIGKPAVKQGNGKNSTFYQHEYVSAKQARAIMRRLACSNDDMQKVTHLIRHHMFYYTLNVITDAGIRRILRRVGAENINDLMAIRMADRMGSGVYKDKPYKLVELEKRLEYVQKDPVSVNMLALDGNILIKDCGMKPGAKIALVLHKLLDEVMDDPKKNTLAYLKPSAENIIKDLANLSESDARTAMKAYKETLADLNAFKE